MREIEDIVRDVEAARLPHAWWPNHPSDDGDPNDPPSKTLYMGATGVIWALEYLAQRQLASLSQSYAPLWQRACEDYRSVPDTGEETPSWFLGWSSLWLMAMLRGPEEARPACADSLYRVVSDNIANPTWEILWGSPGTMLAALFAFESTRDPRWRDLYVRNAERLWEEWRYDDGLDCYVWTQDLYGSKGVIYGGGHGFAGNAFALLRGIDLLPEERRKQIVARIAVTTKRLAVGDSGLANWPVSRGAAHGNARPLLLQWCHGAPGFLMSLAARMPKGEDEELDRLFIDAGELTWRAGPLTKGACFCHGTDGNAMALLALFQRTGDELWLERARAFAMHAVRQSRQNLAKYGRRRYTLWTGDLGLAIVLEACLAGKAHMPMLDFV